MTPKIRSNVSCESVLGLEELTSPETGFSRLHRIRRRRETWKYLHNDSPYVTSPALKTPASVAQTILVEAAARIVLSNESFR